MHGGAFAALELCKRFAFPHEFDYVHVTRYRGGTRGRDLTWRVRPSKALAGRTVLVVDDILDHGKTLRALDAELDRVGVAEQLERGARRQAARAQACAADASPSAVSTVDDVYVFGSGMDYRGYWRGLRGIYAVADGATRDRRSALIVGSGFEQLGFEVLTRSPTKTPYGEPSSPVLTVAIRRRARRVHRAARREPRARAARDQLSRESVGARATRRARGASASTRSARSIARSCPASSRCPISSSTTRTAVESTFGGAGAPVRHIEFTEPFSPVLRGRLATAIADCGFGVRAGTYGVTQGPRLETAAEIERLARDGCAMVGMTAMPEAALARELDIDYAICAVAVNYAAGRSPDGAADRRADRAVHGRRACEGSRGSRATRRRHDEGNVMRFIDVCGARHRT